jgi:hypothetical protein
MSDVPESNSRTADGRFAQGNPGGPGRPRKVVKAAADALDERAAEAAPELFDKALERVREGSDTALRMLLDRIWPAGRSRPMEIGAPQINHLRDLLAAMAGVTNAMFAGDATAQEGAAAAKVLRAHLEAIQTIDIDERLRELEEETREAKERAKPRARYGGADF